MMNPTNWLISHGEDGFRASEILSWAPLGDGEYNIHVKALPGIYSSVILAFNAIQMRIQGIRI